MDTVFEPWALFMKQRLILAGGSGFLGQALAGHFAALGWDVVVLTRKTSAVNTVARHVVWDGKTQAGWTREIEGASAVLNLTGRTVDCRYTAANRRLIMDSRVDSTRVLGEAIARCASKPRVWLNASTATIYLHTLGPAWDESGEIGSTPEAQDEFSVEVAKAWEEALFRASVPGTRTLALRTTMVLGLGRNSVFPVLCRLARFGLGGRMGSGKQFVSWIHLTDFCCAIEFLISRDDLSGVVNLTAPNPVPNHTMMRMFREVCGVPFGLPAAEWMLEVGAFFMRTEMELIIKSRRVIPGKLMAAGFKFQFPEMMAALRDLSARL